MTKWLLSILAVWSLTTAVNANLYHDSNLDWETIETRHFYIHFHDGAEQVARDFIPIANKVHDEVTGYLSWVPEDKVHIVLTDEFDLSNGYATVFPRNNTHIFLSAPDELNSLEDHNGWLELVFFGMLFGCWFQADRRKAYQKALWIGISLLLMFFMLRALDGFGNIRPREGDTWIDFLNVVKKQVYKGLPPSKESAGAAFGKACRTRSGKQSRLIL